ncbi:MAG: hypothetical protein K2N11_03885 [Mucispirillum sp.]|nr:hypothetical protein [Mucispirillum sp.]
MKLYSWNTQKISINDNGKIKTISPFFLVSDDKAYLFENSSYTDLGSIFNIDELKAVSENIEMVTNDIKDIIAEKTNNLVNMQETIESSLNQLKTVSKTMQEIEKLKDEYIQIINQAVNIRTSIQDETDKYMEKLSQFQKDTDTKIKEAEFSFNKARVNISDLMEQAENKVAAKYMAVRLNMDNIYNKYINAVSSKADESKKYAETSKKWACSPLNVPVENGCYSALHYAAIIKNQGTTNE